MEKGIVPDRPQIGTTTGMLLGKFLPPHAGHMNLIETARRFVGELTVLVCTRDCEPIPGDLRFEWMRELFPSSGVRLVHITEDLPQEPVEHPDFWEIWQRVVRSAMPTGPDFVFASDPYGAPLAEVLGARFVPVDLAREMVPVSGEMVRADPMACWEFIPVAVRPYYVKRVCLFGPESTGKSTLARDLARHFETVHAVEFARGLLDERDGRCDPEDLPLIALGQAALEDSLARQANRVLFCDTDLLTTSIWSDVLYGHCPGWIAEAAAERSYDLTLLMDIDVPWVDDAQRYFGHRRDEFFQRCAQALERQGRRTVTIRGSWEERFQRAREAVESLLDRES